MNLKTILGGNSYWTINKTLANKLGLEATLLLQHLIDLQDNYFKDGDFHQSIPRLLKELPLSKHKISSAVKVLTEHSLLLVEKKGNPATNHYTVLSENVISFLDDPATSELKIEPLVEQKLNHTHKRKTHKEKRHDTPEFNSIEKTSAQQKVDQLLRWEKILSVWKSSESSPILKNAFKKFCSLEVEQQEQMVEYLQTFNRNDIDILSKFWISTYLKEGLFTPEILKKDLERNYEANREKYNRDPSKATHNFNSNF